MDNDPETVSDRNFVVALSRGLDVLRAFRPNEQELSNQDIAQRTGLPKPTVTRLTHTLCKLDYLIHSERTGFYRLGAGVLMLGYGVLAGMEIADRAAEELRDLCAGPNPNVTAALGERHRLKVVYTSVRRSREAVALTMSVGARLPLFHSAIGRAILACAGESQREELFELAAKERREDMGLIRANVAQAAEEYRTLGYCSSFGSWRPEINGIAVPVLSLSGDRIYGINVGGPSFLVSPEELSESYAAPLVAVGKSLSQFPARERVIET